MSEDPWPKRIEQRRVCPKTSQLVGYVGRALRKRGIRFFPLIVEGRQPCRNRL